MKHVFISSLSAFVCFYCDVEIGRYSMSYDDFFDSFKTRGDVNGDTMSMYAQIFNDKSTHDALSKPFLKKFMFTSHICKQPIHMFSDICYYSLHPSISILALLNFYNVGNVNERS
jgi:hypothetical protein